MERRGGWGARGGAWAIRCNLAASSQVTTGRLDTTTAILCAEGGRDGDVDDDGGDDVADSRTSDSRIGASRKSEGSRVGGEGPRVGGEGSRIGGSLRGGGSCVGDDPWVVASRTGDSGTGDSRNGDRARGGGRE